VATLGWVMLATLLCWWGFRVPAGMGEGPAGPEVPAAAFETRWMDRPVALVSLGDSVSTGFGAPEGLGFFDLVHRNRDDVYPEMRGRDLSSVMGPIRIVRMARNSTNSSAHEDAVDRLSDFAPETFGIVCVTSGGIDLIHPYGKAAPREGAMFGADFATASPWIERFEQRL
jgi:hypothetical protein